MTCINPKKALLITREMYDNGELIKVQKQMKILEVKYQETKTEEIRQGKKTLIIKSEPIELPCRKCIGCKLDKANDWATRSIIEAKSWKNNCFVTLTYDEEHIPKHRLLQKSDVQKFWKRLRKQEEGYEEWRYKGKTTKPIRYFVCGEYGPKTERPHYHAGIFNWKPDDLKPFKQNACGDWLYTSEKLQKIWENGFVIIGEMTYASAAYIARYTMKKAYKSYIENKPKIIIKAKQNETLNKKTKTIIKIIKDICGAEKIIYTRENNPEYIDTSRNGGIGIATWNKDDQKEVIKRNFGYFVKTKDKTILKKIPQFLRQKWQKEDEIEYTIISENYRKQLHEEQKTKIKKTQEQLKREYEIKAKLLPRKQI